MADGELFPVNKTSAGDRGSARGPPTLIDPKALRRKGGK
jgi:hypothetical protein